MVIRKVRTTSYCDPRRCSPGAHPFEVDRLTFTGGDQVVYEEFWEWTDGDDWDLYATLEECLEAKGR